MGTLVKNGLTYLSRYQIVLWVLRWKLIFIHLGTHL